MLICVPSSLFIRYTTPGSGEPSSANKNQMIVIWDEIKQALPYRKEHRLQKHIVEAGFKADRFNKRSSHLVSTPKLLKPVKSLRFIITYNGRSFTEPVAIFIPLKEKMVRTNFHPFHSVFSYSKARLTGLFLAFKQLYTTIRSFPVKLSRQCHLLSPVFP